MLRDAKTTSIADRAHRPPLGGYTAPAAKAAGIEHMLRSASGMNLYKTLIVANTKAVRGNSPYNKQAH
jgi:hypothetical protein